MSKLLNNLNEIDETQTSIQDWYETASGTDIKVIFGFMDKFFVNNFITEIVYKENSLGNKTIRITEAKLSGGTSYLKYLIDTYGNVFDLILYSQRHNGQGYILVDANCIFKDLSFTLSPDTIILETIYNITVVSNDNAKPIKLIEVENPRTIAT